MSDKLTVYSDERLGLPSCSQFPILFACEGALHLQSLMEEKYDSTSKDAIRGTEIHEANRSGDVSELDDADAEVVSQIRATEEKLVGDWIADTGHTLADVTIYREHRMWCDFFSGQADTLVVNHANNTAYVLDTKTGKKVVAPPVRNMQLRGIAVLVRMNFGVATVRTAIIQPMVKSSAACDYSTDHLERAYWIIVSRLRHCKSPGLPLTTGEHCSYCRALPICSEARKHMSLAISASKLMWSAAEDEQKAALFKAAKVAKACAEKILELCAIDMSDEATKIKGLVKANDQSPRKVTDPAGLAKLLVDTACFEDAPMDERYEMLLQFVKKTKVPIKAVMEFYAEQMPSKSKSEAEKFIAHYGHPFIENGHRRGAISVEEKE